MILGHQTSTYVSTVGVFLVGLFLWRVLNDIKLFLHLTVLFKRNGHLLAALVKCIDGFGRLWLYWFDWRAEHCIVWISLFREHVCLGLWLVEVACHSSPLTIRSPLFWCNVVVLTEYVFLGLISRINVWKGRLPILLITGPKEVSLGSWVLSQQSTHFLTVVSLLKFWAFLRFCRWFWHRLLVLKSYNHCRATILLSGVLIIIFNLNYLIFTAGLGVKRSQITLGNRVTIDSFQHLAYLIIICNIALGWPWWLRLHWFFLQVRIDYLDVFWIDIRLSQRWAGLLVDFVGISHWGLERACGLQILGFAWGSLLLSLGYRVCRLQIARLHLWLWPNKIR